MAQIAREITHTSKTNKRGSIFDAWRASTYRPGRLAKKNNRPVSFPFQDWFCRLDLWFLAQRSYLGTYLHKVALLAVTMSFGKDELFLRDRLSENSIHMRRVLNGSFYPSLDYSPVYKQTSTVLRATTAEEASNPRLIVVDQLWLWIMDDSKMLSPHVWRRSWLRFDTIISFCPRRWGSKVNGTSVYTSLKRRIARLPYGEIRSIHDLGT